MRIGTWNVQYATGPDKNARRLRRLREMNCDVWVLTETHLDLDLAPDHSPVGTSQRMTGRSGARWTTIWSRFPITKILPVEDPHRTVAALLESSVGPLVVFGTVLPWHSDPGPNNDATGWAEHHRIIPMQVREWVKLRDEFPHAALCVAGDLNMNLGGRHWYGTREGREMLRTGLKATGLFCATETERIPEGLLSHGPIDHICLSDRFAKNTTVAGAWEGKDGDGVGLSDYSGLVVEIR